jgi:hypothetical protein
MFYQIEGFLFYLGIPNAQNVSRNDDGTVGSSYIVFGQRKSTKVVRSISLLSPLDSGYYAKVAAGNGGIIPETSNTQSLTFIGDINGDTFVDILIGRPFVSKCSFFYGDAIGFDGSTGLAALSESFSIHGDPTDLFGWSSSRIGDVNQDGLDEILTSAIGINMVFIIYGKRSFPPNVNIHELTAADYVKIESSDTEVNFGVSISLARDFNGDHYRDLLIACVDYVLQRNVIYVLFGPAAWSGGNSVKISNLPSTAYLKITAPDTFTGYSVAGIGDINGDGYDDIALGRLTSTGTRLPLERTFVIYGNSKSSGSFELSEMTSEDGFIIYHGGFFVKGIGDVNADGIADFMICSYPSWQGKANTYFIQTPSNMTTSPTFLPTMVPSVIPTISPSFSLSPTFVPSAPSPNITSHPTFLATEAPTFLPTEFPISLEPTIGPTRANYVLTSAKPSKRPTKSPVLKITRKPTINPTITATSLRTAGHNQMSSEPFVVIDSPENGVYYGTTQNNHFIISATHGNIEIVPAEATNNTNLYLFLPSTAPVTEKQVTTINNFHVNTDIINLSRFRTIRNITDIPYVVKSTPNNNQYIIIMPTTNYEIHFPSISSFNLFRPSNFYFFIEISPNIDNTRSQQLTMIVISGTIAVFFCLAFFLKKPEPTEKEKETDDYENEEILDGRFRKKSVLRKSVSSVSRGTMFLPLELLNRVKRTTLLFFKQENNSSDHSDDSFDDDDEEDDEEENTVVNDGDDDENEDHDDDADDDESLPSISFLFNLFFDETKEDDLSSIPSSGFHFSEDALSEREEDENDVVYYEEKSEESAEDSQVEPFHSGFMDKRYYNEAADDFEDYCYQQESISTKHNFDNPVNFIENRIGDYYSYHDSGYPCLQDSNQYYPPTSENHDYYLSSPYMPYETEYYENNLTGNHDNRFDSGDQFDEENVYNSTFNRSSQYKDHDLSASINFCEF